MTSSMFQRVLEQIMIIMFLVYRLNSQLIPGTVVLTSSGDQVPSSNQFPKTSASSSGSYGSFFYDFPPGTSRTGQLVSDLEDQESGDNQQIYGGSCYRTRNGCQCDDGYRWQQEPDGPFYSGCANPSNDPSGSWCPLRSDVPCLVLDQGFDYCFEQDDLCPEEGKPIYQCTQKTSAMNIWRCINAVRTNPKAFTELFQQEIGSTCQPLETLSRTQFTALGGEAELFDMAQAESFERSFNASALFKVTTNNDDLSLQERMEILSFSWDMHVKIIRASPNAFSVASLASYLFCQDPNNQMYLSCSYDQVGVGLSQDSLSNDIYVTLILGCPKDKICTCSK